MSEIGKDSSDMKKKGRQYLMSMLKERHDITDSALVDVQGKPTGLYRRCPHCGMVDHQYSAQGANQAHHQITRVGALLKYECGKCRKRFHVIEVCVPADIDPMTYYEKISELLRSHS